MRDQNEDGYLVREDRRATLLAVADGVGGEAGGEIASASALEALARRFFGTPRATAPAEALATAMRDANDAVLAKANESGHRGAASTLVAAAVAGKDVVVGNLGDSRAYVVSDGAIRLITADHSGAYPSSITRFVGDPRGVQPDVFVETLRPGDRLVLCSDGLTRHVTDDEIAARVAGRDLHVSVNTLVDLANERGGEDNVTVVVYGAGRTMLSSLSRGAVNVVIAVLAAIVVGGAVGALVFASGVLPASR